MEDTIPYLVGLLFIVIGFLIVRFPMMLSGYNTLPKEVRDKIDTPAMTRAIRSVMITIGSIIPAASLLFDKFGLNSYIHIIIIVTIMAGVIPVAIIQNKYTKTPLFKKQPKQQTS